MIPGGASPSTGWCWSASKGFFIIYQTQSATMHLSTAPAHSDVLGPEVNPLCGARLMNGVTTLDEVVLCYFKCERCTRIAGRAHEQRERLASRGAV